MRAVENENSTKTPRRFVIVQFRMCGDLPDRGVEHLFQFDAPQRRTIIECGVETHSGDVVLPAPIKVGGHVHWEVRHDAKTDD